MGRLVLIRDLEDGTKGDSSQLYHAPKGGYYSSEEAYIKTTKKKAIRMKCIDAILAFLDYETGMKANTQVFRKLKELESYGYDVILLTVQDCTEAINYALTHKTFKSETQKINYIYAILANHINDVYQAKKRDELRQKKSTEVIEIDDFIPHKQKTKDISRWLDDE